MVAESDGSAIVVSGVSSKIKFTIWEHGSDTYSKHFNGLPAEDRLSYTNNLMLSNGVRFPDLHSLSGQWVKDPTKCPKSQSPDIFVYLVGNLVSVYLVSI